MTPSHPARLITRRDAALLVALFLVSRIVLTLIGTIGVLVLPSVSEEEGAYTLLNLRDGGPALDMWYRFDAGFYATIASDGYTWQNTATPAADMAFMPLYPLLVRAASGLMPSGCALSPYLSTCTTIGGLIVSNAALLASVVVLFWLTAARHDRPTAWRAALLLLASPIGIFLSGVYTESLFLLLTLIVFAALHRGWFVAAVAVACAAALTRPVGIALVPALLWHVYATRPASGIDLGTAARAALALLPGVIFGGYILFMGLTVGDPLAYFSSYELTWQRTAGTPLEAFTIYITALLNGERVSLWGWEVSWIDLAVTLGALALAAGLTLRARGMQRADGLFALGGLALPIASGTLIGMPRFAATLFPFYIVLARWADRPWRMVIVYGAAIGLAVLFALRFVTGRWIA